MTDMTDLMIRDDEPYAVARVEPPEAGTLALALMSDDEFSTRLAALRKGRDRIVEIQRSLMDKDVDYGTIRGTPKPTLYKPGAEKLCDFYHFAADFRPERLTGDNVTSPALAYQTRCELHLGSLDGPVVAVGYGSANSWERKHRYRTGERACPACGSIGTLLRSKRGEPEWFCWAKKGGCGETFDINDPAVVSQAVGDVENPDPWDLDTTLLKMAEKRAHVDATLRATASSGLFTQDVEDLPAPPEPPPAKPAPRNLTEVVERRREEERPPQLPEATPLPSEAPEPSETPTEDDGRPHLSEAAFKGWLVAARIPIPKAQEVRLSLFPDAEPLDDYQRAELQAALEPLAI